MADIRPILDTSSKTSGVMRMTNGGRLDFWTLENQIAGRGRRYHRIVIDEAAFTKDGDNKVDGSMMQLWETAIKPTLYDFGGEALVCSNSAGKNSETFFLQYLHRSPIWLRGIPRHHKGQSGTTEASSE